MHLRRPVLITTLFLLAACSSPQDATVQLRILETSDIHMHVVDYDYFQDQPSVTVGLARTAALLAAARAEATNSVLVDNGDLLQGNPLGDFMARHRGLQDGAVHPVYKAMNLLDYTVANIGNHEFNYGLEFLEKSIAGANFPYISANVSLTMINRPLSVEEKTPTMELSTRPRYFDSLLFSSLSIIFRSVMSITEPVEPIYFPSLS